MRKNDALAITRDEWKEIMLVPEVHATFEIKSSETVDDFGFRIYGAKYVFDDPDYDGIIYTLVYQFSSKDKVVILERYKGVLRAM